MKSPEASMTEASAAGSSIVPVAGSNRSRLMAGIKSATAGLCVGIITSMVTLLFTPDVQELVYRYWPSEVEAVHMTPSMSELEAEANRIQHRVKMLQSRLRSRLPRSAYLVVSTSDNRFELFGRNGLTREGTCSTGSYVLLRGGDNQEWMFETPRGVFRIIDKRVNPVWSKPDWAFVEDGLPIPAQGAPERFERGVLGKYALAIGNGYLIHGTLYQRMLGQPVTHGCIRLADADLEAVYRDLALGARVYIY